MNQNRRHFLSATTAGVVASGLSPYILGQAKSGKKYRTALIGSGWWGMNILRVALADGSCDVVALCDVDSDELEAGQRIDISGECDNDELLAHTIVILP